MVYTSHSSTTAQVSGQGVREPEKRRKGLMSLTDSVTQLDNYTGDNWSGEHRTGKQNLPIIMAELIDPFAARLFGKTR
ncbi:hypothetical protein LguiA_024662 [Lonicera macranthoides]